MWLDGRPGLAQQLAGYQAALGNMALLSGNTNEARGRFERAVALDSKEPSAYLGMAELGRLAGDATRARALFKQAVDLSPVRSGARLRYTAFLLTEPGQLEEARNQLARILSGAPDFLPALMLKARLELSNRQWDDCAGTLERIERQMGANYDTALLRGQVLIGQASAADSAVGRQRLDEAVALLTKLAEAHTNSFEALYFKAVAEAGRGDGENAVRDLAKSLGLLSTNALSKPQSIQAVLLLAELEAQQGNAERASMLVTKYLAEMGPQAPAAALQTVGMQLARLQVLAGRYADAISRYQSLAQQNPKDPRFSLLMGGVFLMQSEQAERKKDTAEAARLRRRRGASSSGRWSCNRATSEPSLLSWPWTRKRGSSPRLRRCCRRPCRPSRTLRNWLLCWRICI
jgi:tetratricopeptide (TPR) repeat protein